MLRPSVQRILARREDSAHHEPNDLGFVGLTLAAQSIAHAPHVNAFGLVTSNHWV